MSTKYYPTIGLEIHAHPITKTKMFCRCENNPFDGDPNAHTCPVCTAQPGALPVVNKEALAQTIRLGLALGSEIANFTEFDRKSYFYPDLPKSYQISQYQYPVVSGGELAGVKIERVHLEEDAAINRHEGDHTLVNYNRGGVPLMELVTEPVIHSAEEAMAFGRALQLLLRRIGVSHADMEKGQMRVEVNISISSDPDVLGTKVEVKNIGSFNAAGRAIEYEIARMTKLYDEGRADEIVQETRGWDDAKQKTVRQRIKEGSADYRYFPEPDIPKFYLHEIFDIEAMRAELPELPDEQRARYQNDFGIKDEDIDTYLQDHDLSVLFENTVIAFRDDKKLITTTSNYITSDLLGLMKATDQDSREMVRRIEPDKLADLMQMVSANEVNSRGAKDILAIMAMEGGDPRAIAEEKGLLQENDEDAIREIAQKIIDENQSVVEEYKGGKEASLKFLIGQGMKLTQGSANPQMLESMFKELIA